MAALRSWGVSPSRLSFLRRMMKCNYLPLRGWMKLVAEGLPGLVPFLIFLPMFSSYTGDACLTRADGRTTTAGVMLVVAEYQFLVDLPCSTHPAPYCIAPVDDLVVSNSAGRPQVGQLTSSVVSGI